MKSKNFIVMILLTITIAQLQAQSGQPEKPVKTGNEWKMPSDVLKRSREFAGKLQKKLDLDDGQAKKVYDAYLANTKPLDEISVQQIPEKEKTAKLNANRAAFNETLKGILTPAQYAGYLKMDISNK